MLSYSTFLLNHFRPKFQENEMKNLIYINDFQFQISSFFRIEYGLIKRCLNYILNLASLKFCLYNNVFPLYSNIEADCLNTLFQAKLSASPLLINFISKSQLRRLLALLSNYIFLESYILQSTSNITGFIYFSSLFRLNNISVRHSLLDFI